MAMGLLSWIVLASWWMRAGAAVGVVPSLAVLTGLTLVTFAGHAWVSRWRQKTTASAVGFGEGLYLGLVGHLFLLAVSTNPAWSIPPLWQIPTISASYRLETAAYRFSEVTVAATV